MTAFSNNGHENGPWPEKGPITTAQFSANAIRDLQCRSSLELENQKGRDSRLFDGTRPTLVHSCEGHSLVIILRVRNTCSFKSITLHSELRDLFQISPLGLH